MCSSGLFSLVFLSLCKAKEREKEREGQGEGRRSRRGKEPGFFLRRVFFFLVVRLGLSAFDSLFLQPRIRLPPRLPPRPRFQAPPWLLPSASRLPQVRACRCCLDRGNASGAAALERRRSTEALGSFFRSAVLAASASFRSPLLTAISLGAKVDSCLSFRLRATASEALCSPFFASRRRARFCLAAHTGEQEPRRAQRGAARTFGRRP